MFWWFGVRATSTGSGTETTTTASIANTPPGQGPVAISQAGLATLASLGRSIYWAGPQPTDTLELTQNPGGRVHLRNRPPGMPVGSPELPGLDYQIEVYDPVAAAARRLARSTQLRRLDTG